MDGKSGAVAFVDLGTGVIEERKLDEALYERWIGGAMLGAALLSELIPAGADPLGPENALAFMPGRLTGTGALMTGRWTVCAKSPLTGGWGDANCGGTLAPAIKRCGWDGIVFTGIAPKPVVFVCDERGPRLEDASGLWGLDAVETEERVAAAWAARGGKLKPAIATIGPAGEKLSLISGISNDGGRYAARSGVGAVMGSKRLKAVALAGSKPVGAADPEAMKALSASYAAAVNGVKLPGFIRGRALTLMGRLLGMKTVLPLDGILVAGIFKRWGTIYNNMAGIVNGDSPVKNWAGSVKDFGPERYVKLDPDRIVARERKKYRCYSCVIGCGGEVDAPSGGLMHKPEYETCCAFGPLLLNDDLDAVFLCNELCNRAGLDTISAGSTIAFAMECWEKGIITRADTGGLALVWGDPKAIVALLKLMIAREGIGELLADGVAKAAERIGRGAKACAVLAGAQEPGMHDGRMDPIMSISYAADPTPGRHTVGAGAYYNVSKIWEFVSWAPRVTRPYLKAKEYEDSDDEALKAAALSAFKQLLDAAGGCLFALTTGLNHWRFFDMLNAATGAALSPDEWMAKGAAAQKLRRDFNAAQGLGRAAWHPRLSGDEALERGPLAGKSLPLAAMVRRFERTIAGKAGSGSSEPAASAR